MRDPEHQDPTPGPDGSGGNVTPPDPSIPESSPGAHPTASEEAGAQEPEGAAEAEADDSLDAVAADIDRALAERDEYLDSLRRLQADFENYRKRIARQEADHLARASEALVVNLLPVLDACDAAVAHGAGDVRPIADALFAVLEREGLERLQPEGKPFNPEEHEAVAHVPGGATDAEGEAEGEAGSAAGQVVADVMRAGYRFKGRVLRPAMVAVRG